MNPTPARVLLILQLFFSVGSTHTLTDPSIGLLMQKIQKIITAMYVQKYNPFFELGPM